MYWSEEILEESFHFHVTWSACLLCDWEAWDFDGVISDHYCLFVDAFLDENREDFEEEEEADEEGGVAKVEEEIE